MEERRSIALNRRSVIKAAAASGAAVLGAPASAGRLGNEKKRHAIVGTGHRARVYQDAIWGKHKDRNALVALCDTNPGRLAFSAKRAAAAGAATPKVYLARDFDRMIREMRVDTIIVTTPDASHDDYIVRALDAGCDVITEKPMPPPQPRRSASSRPSSGTTATSGSPSTIASRRLGRR